MSIFELPDASLCVRLAATMGHFLWQGAAVYLLVILAGLVLRRSSAGARYAVFTAALLVMAVCPPATFMVLRSPEMPPVVSGGQSPSYVPSDDAEMGAETPSAFLGGQSPPYLSGESPAYLSEAVPPPAAETVSLAVPDEPAVEAIDWWRYAPWLVACHLGGTTLMFARLLVALCGGQRLRRRSEPVADSAILAAFARQARAVGLRFTPAIAFCREVAVPTVVGVLRPMILLPLSAVSGLTTEQIEVLLAHELAHIRRHDHIVNILQRLIEALLFFHPAVWFVSRRIRIEREHCCDDLVLAVGGKRLAYAESLVRMAELARAGGQSTPYMAAAAAALGAADRPSQLRRRILRLISGGAGEQVRLFRPAVLGLCVFLMLAAVACVHLASSRTDERVGDAVPPGAAGTWFFENPMGDDEQMAVFPDGRVVVLYSNGHRDETRYTDGVIELAEYGNVKAKLLLLPDGRTLQTRTESSGIAKLWQRIDAAPKTELLRPLTESPTEPAATQTAAEEAAPSADAVAAHTSDTQNGLRLSIKVEPTDICEADTLKLTAMFENVSDKPLKLFVPFFHGPPSVRDWRLTRADGVTFVPFEGDYQTVEGPGLQGEIREILPGQPWVLTYEVRLLTGVQDASGPPQAAISFLSRGEYAVSFSYARRDKQVPFTRFDPPGSGTPRIVTERQEIEDLWTGEVQAAPVKITVRPTGMPSVHISGPAEARIDDDCVVEYTIRNPGPKPLSWNGRFALAGRRPSESQAQWSLKLANVTTEAAGYPGSRLDLPAGTTRSGKINLKEVMSQAASSGSRTGSPAPAFLDPRGGIVEIRLVFVEPYGMHGTISLESNPLFVAVRGKSGEPIAKQPVETPPALTVDQALTLLSTAAGGARGRAAEQLVRLDDHSAVPKLLPLLKADNAEVRWRAAWVLANLADLTAGDALAEALTDSDARVRRFAGCGVRVCGNRSHVARLVSALVQARMAARFDEALILLAAIRGLEPQVPREVISLVGKIGQEPGVDADRAPDPAPDRRWEFYTALVQCVRGSRAPEAREALAGAWAAMNEKTQDYHTWYVLRQAVSAFGPESYMPYRKALELLDSVRTADMTAEEIHEQWVAPLASLGNEALPELWWVLKFKGERDGDRRQVATQALSELSAVATKTDRYARTVNRLQLNIEATPAVVDPGDTLKLVATIENVSGATVRFFKPRHFDLASLGNWRFVRSDSMVFTAWPMPFQTAEGSGMQGEILTLAGHEKRLLAQADVRLLVAANLPPSQRAWEHPLPPEPGEYAISFMHQQVDNRVPFEEFGTGGSEDRPIDGLWTGKLESNRVRLTVRPSTRPSLRISASGEVKVGDPCPLTIRFSNPADQPLRLSGALYLQVSSMASVASLRFSTSPTVSILANGEHYSLEVPARGVREFAVDAAAWPLTPSEQQWQASASKPASVRLYDVFRDVRTGFYLEFVGEELTHSLKADPIYTVFRRKTSTGPPPPYISPPATQSAEAVQRSIEQDMSVSLGQPEAPGGGSRAWYVLRQLNCGPLLREMPLQFAKASDPAVEASVLREDLPGGVPLEIDVRLEDDAAGEMLIGLFTDENWSRIPVRVAEIIGGGRHTIKGVPPGKYQIGVMMGTLLEPTALGVQKSWPEPVEVAAGRSEVVEVLVSPQFEHSLGQSYRQIAEACHPLRKVEYPDSLVQGRVTDASGKPAVHAIMQIREHTFGPRPRSIWAIDTGTDDLGRYFFDKKAGPFTISTVFEESLPGVLGSRSQFARAPGVHYRKEEVNLALKPFPRGSASLSGRGVDQDGKLVQGFVVDIRQNAEIDEERQANVVFTYRVPCWTADGRFVLTDLPPGKHRVTGLPFDLQTYQFDFGDSADVELKDGETADVEVLMKRKTVLYGRVLMEDGAVPAAAVKPPWPGALMISCSYNNAGMSWGVGEVDSEGYATVRLDKNDREALESGKATLSIDYPIGDSKESGGWKRVGVLPFDELSADRAKAGVLKIRYVDLPEPRLAEAEHKVSAVKDDSFVGREVSCQGVIRDSKIEMWKRGEGGDFILEDSSGRVMVYCASGADPGSQPGVPDVRCAGFRMPTELRDGHTVLVRGKLRKNPGDGANARPEMREPFYYIITASEITLIRSTTSPATRQGETSQIILESPWAKGRVIDGAGRKFGIEGPVYVFDPADPKLETSKPVSARSPMLDIREVEFMSRDNYPRVDVAFQFRDGKTAGGALFEMTLLGKNKETLGTQRVLELRNREMPKEVFASFIAGGDDPPNRSGKAELYFRDVSPTDVDSFRLIVSEPDVAGLIQLLDEKDIYPRESAARALGQVGPPAQPAVPKLTQFLDDPQPRLRDAARQALERIRATSTRPDAEPTAKQPVPVGGGSGRSGDLPYGTLQPATAAIPAKAGSGAADTANGDTAEHTVDLVDRLIAARDANKNGIMTWRGRAVVETRIELGHGETVDTSSRTAAFAFSREFAATRWNLADRRRSRTVDGRSTDEPLVTVAGMMRNGVYYRAGPNLKPRDEQRHVLQILHQGELSRDGIGGSLDPMRFLEDATRSSGGDVKARLQFVHKQADSITGGAPSTPWTISQEGTRVTVESVLVPIINRYVFDLAQGGNLVSLYEKDGQVSVESSTAYMQSDGLWVPQSFEHQHSGMSGDGKSLQITRSVVFAENVVNQPVDPSEFDIEKLGVQRGDRVSDRVNSLTYDYAGRLEGPQARAATRPAVSTTPDSRAGGDLDLEELKELLKRGPLSYEKARQMIRPDQAHELYPMLERLTFWAEGRNLSRVIGYVTKDEQAVRALLVYAKKTGGQYAFESIGLIGGSLADNILRLAFNGKATEEMSRGWSEDESELLSGWTIPDYLAKEVKSAAAIGLVLTRKPENIALVREAYEAHRVYPKDWKERGLYIADFNQMTEAMAVNDIIDEKGLEYYLSQLGTGTREWSMLHPYLVKHMSLPPEDQEASAPASDSRSATRPAVSTASDSRTGGDIDLEELEALLKRGSLTYEEARRVVRPGQVPELCRMLKDPAFGEHWNNIATLIGYVARDDEAAVAALRDYVTRPIDWSVEDAERQTHVGHAKLGALQSIGLVGGRLADETLRQAMTPEGAEVLSKHWTKEGGVLGGFGSLRHLIQLTRHYAGIGLVLTRKPENVAMVKEAYEKERVYPKDWRERGLNLGEFNQMTRAMMINEIIEEKGMEYYLKLSTLDSATHRLSMLSPYFDKYWSMPPEEQEASAPASDSRSATRPAPSDVADVPVLDLNAGGNEKMRYFLIGPRPDERVPAAGYKLVVGLPGGNGGVDFHPFVCRLFKFGIPAGYVVAQPVAFAWAPDQQIVWPTRMNKVPGQQFATEDFVEAVIKDVRSKHKLDDRHIYTLSWSSGGPAAYAVSLAENSPVAGSFVAMSVFRPDQLPSLDRAKGRAYYLYHSPNDRVCPYRMAEEAESILKEKAAAVTLKTYQGGHGWQGGAVYGAVRDGIRWLEKQAPEQ